MAPYLLTLTLVGLVPELSIPIQHEEASWSRLHDRLSVSVTFDGRQVGYWDEDSGSYQIPAAELSDMLYGMTYRVQSYCIEPIWFEMAPLVQANPLPTLPTYTLESVLAASAIVLATPLLRGGVDGFIPWFRRRRRDEDGIPPDAEED